MRLKFESACPRIPASFGGFFLDKPEHFILFCA